MTAPEPYAVLQLPHQLQYYQNVPATGNINNNITNISYYGIFYLLQAETFLHKFNINGKINQLPCKDKLTCKLFQKETKHSVSE